MLLFVSLKQKIELQIGILLNFNVYLRKGTSLQKRSSFLPLSLDCFMKPHKNVSMFLARHKMVTHIASQNIITEGMAFPSLYAALISKLALKYNFITNAFNRVKFNIQSHAFFAHRHWHSNLILH
jgi:hypothetical protein